MVLCIGGIITVGSGWFAFTFFSGTLKKIDIEKGGSAATTDKIVSIDPKKLHMMVTTVTHRDVSTIETLPAVSDPSL